jgi:hypothetical protein
VINIVEDWPEGLRFWTAVVDSGGQFGHEGLLVRRQVVTIRVAGSMVVVVAAARSNLVRF